MKEFMKNSYRSTSCIIPFLLMAFSGITLSGCGDDRIALNTLIESPDDYKNKTVEVYGQIVAIESKDKTLLVLIEDNKSGGDPSLICEFLKDEQRGSLSKGSWVLISGKVDILAGVTLLRECEIKED